MVSLKNPEQSTTYSSTYTAAKAIDRNTDSYSSTNKESSPWWTVELVQPVLMTKVELYLKSSLSK